MLINADLHIHSPFSIGTSRFMDLARLFTASTQKGLHVIGSGDALHPEWREKCAHFDDHGDLLLLPTVEVEDEHRIHHLILMEDFPSCRELASALASYSKNIAISGRPHIATSGEIIAQEVHQLGGLIGPAHAFTPWTSLFASFDHLQEAYGEEPVDFLELGLSADSNYAEGIPDLVKIPFLSNSDAHSAEAIRVGREWNQLDVKNLSPRAILECIARGKIAYNAGLFPEVGKYNRTACSRCFRHFSPLDMKRYHGRCPEDGGRIKKGVYDRARELSTAPSGPRPPYFHRIALGELIQQELGTCSPFTKRCRILNDRLIAHFGSEIPILMDSPIAEIRTLHEGLAESIQALRAGEIEINAGGGGRYGTFFLKRKHYGMYTTT